jgi:hypothetical protein
MMTLKIARTTKISKMTFKMVMRIVMEGVNAVKLAFLDYPARGFTTTVQPCFRILDFLSKSATPKTRSDPKWAAHRCHLPSNRKQNHPVSADVPKD